MDNKGRGRFVEVHTLHSVPPSNLNRDDTGAHKRQNFGGVERLSLSPQSQKRATRIAIKQHGLPETQQGLRTERLPAAVARDLEALGWSAEDARQAVLTAFAVAGITVDIAPGKDDDLTTDVALFVPAVAVAEVTNVIREFKTPLLAKTGPKMETAGKIQAAMKDAFDPTTIADIALAGRFMAKQNATMETVEAALFIAHAIGVNAARVASGLDFYSAVDDLKVEEGIQGAGFLSTREFGSTVFYRYAVVDTNRLASNLGGNVELAEEALEAFVRVFPLTLPSGMTTNTAPFTRPSLVMVTTLTGQPMSLANAFAKPLTVRGTESLIEKAILALDCHLAGEDAVFEEIINRVVAVHPLYAGALTYLAPVVVPTFAEVVASSGDVYTFDARAA